MNRPLDSKPIRDLLLEYKAEVVEEELVDDEADVSINYSSCIFIYEWILFNLPTLNLYNHVNFLNVINI